MLGAGRADMSGTVGGGHRRNKRSITSGASSWGHWPKRAPAVGTKMGHEVIAQRAPTHHTLNGEEKSCGTA